MVTRGHVEKAVIYYDLTMDTGWHYVSQLPHDSKQWGMRMVSLTSQDVILIGGWNSWLNHNKRNFFVYNKDSFKFEVEEKRNNVYYFSLF